MNNRKLMKKMMKKKKKKKKYGNGNGNEWRWKDIDDSILPEAEMRGNGVEYELMTTGHQAQRLQR